MMIGIGLGLTMARVLPQPSGFVVLVDEAGAVLVDAEGRAVIVRIEQ